MWRVSRAEKEAKDMGVKIELSLWSSSKLRYRRRV